VPENFNTTENSNAKKSNAKENLNEAAKIQFLQNVKMTYFLTIVNLNLLNVKTLLLISQNKL